MAKGNRNLGASGYVREKPSVPKNYRAAGVSRAAAPRQKKDWAGGRTAKEPGRMRPQGWQ